MQPPYDPQTLNSILDQKSNLIKKFEKWEKDYFKKIIFFLLYSMMLVGLRVKMIVEGI